MIDFSADVTYGKAAVQPDRRHPQPATTFERPARPTETTTVSLAATDLLDAPEDWSWEQLRDYVLRAVTQRHGPQPTRDPAQINSIFRSFVARWGAQAGPIARFAFEQQDGFWNSAPVTVTRFTKGCDNYFAEPIADRLAVS
jgi:hypothetical protein